MSFDPTGKSIDAILDYGAPGLRYWEHFLPLYAKVFGAPHGMSLTDLYARYDEQRGMNLDEFDAARTELDKAVTEGETRWAAHQSVAQTLPTTWTGATGTEALAVVTSQLRQARDDLDSIRTTATTIREALDPLRRAVLTKAEHTLGLLEPTPDGKGHIAIGGKSPDDIEALDATDPWLTTTFRPDIDHKLAAFTAACDTTDQAFDSHYRTIITAFAQVIDHPYAQPAPTLLSHPDPTPDPNPPVSQPTSIAPHYPATSAVPATAADPAHTPAQPAHPSTPAGGADPNVSSPPDNADRPAEPPRSGSPATRAGAPLETSPAQATPAELPATQVAAPAEPPTAPAESTPPPAESANAPAVSEPAKPDSFTRTLKATLDQLETGLQQGVSTALEKLAALADPTSGLTGGTAATDDPKSGTDHPATPEHNANPEQPADPEHPANPKTPDNSALPTGHLEFDLAGKHFALERTPDGEMSLAITDESGHTRTWTLTFDESGNPTLATEDPNLATPPESFASGPSQPESPTPTPDPGSAVHPAAPGAPPSADSDPAAPSPATTCGPPPPCADPAEGRPLVPEPRPDISEVCPATPEPQLPPPNLDPTPPDSVIPDKNSGLPPTAGSACTDAALPGSAPDNTPTHCAAPPESAVRIPPPPAPDLGAGPPTGQPAPETHPLGSPDESVEIPEGGVEIPELTQPAT
ncbi:hypothetical protein ACFXHA_06460 [Nocardia sp. NPDC059240]|uniref:hypothetical protein n=1 Tax=Nocardia sp. NPDC059240 TaxID=3346786 RepID=UPI0036918700